MSYEEFASALRARMREAVLSFPLTPFTEDLAVDADAFRGHLQGQLAAGPSAIFPCCGTGEFFSLSLPEYEQLVGVAVEEASRSRTPVIAGVGYGWAQGAQFARAAEEMGADAALVLPHYLVGAPQAGLVAQVRELAARTSLPLIVYQRDQVKFTAASVAELATIPNVIGLKDGHGDLDQLQRLRLAAPADFLFFNGVPTAEMQARSYFSIGITAYSSAVHAFAPEISHAFFAALTGGETAVVERLLREFYWPLVELRDRQKGYAVALVKAAARLRGQPVGPVRPPLVDLTPDELEVLSKLVETGLSLVEKENA